MERSKDADRRSGKKFSPGKVIGIVLALAFLDSDIAGALIGLAVMALPAVLLIRALVKWKKGAASNRSNRSFDDCPKKLFCFHKDKGMHHVRSGRELDPWDRPDIDISKYQRRQSR